MAAHDFGSPAIWSVDNDALLTPYLTAAQVARIKTSETAKKQVHEWLKSAGLSFAKPSLPEDKQEAFRKQLMDYCASELGAKYFPQVEELPKDRHAALDAFEAWLEKEHGIDARFAPIFYAKMGGYVAASEELMQERAAAHHHGALFDKEADPKLGYHKQTDIAHSDFSRRFAEVIAIAKSLRTYETDNDQISDELIRLMNRTVFEQGRVTLLRNPSAIHALKQIEVEGKIAVNIAYQETDMHDYQAVPNYIVEEVAKAQKQRLQAAISEQYSAILARKGAALNASDSQYQGRLTGADVKKDAHEL